LSGGQFFGEYEEDSGCHPRKKDSAGSSLEACVHAAFQSGGPIAVNQPFTGIVINNRCGQDEGLLGRVRVTCLKLTGESFNLGSHGRALAAIAQPVAIILPGTFLGLWCIGQRCIPLDRSGLCLSLCLTEYKGAELSTFTCSPSIVNLWKLSVSRHFLSTMMRDHHPLCGAQSRLLKNALRYDAILHSPRNTLVRSRTLRFFANNCLASQAAEAVINSLLALWPGD